MTELECRPLRTLKEIEEWTSEDVLNKLKQSTICLRKKGHVNERVPRTLVCHDMREGYLEDRLYIKRCTYISFDCNIYIHMYVVFVY